MAALFVMVLIALLALQIVTSNTRWMFVAMFGLLVYAFPLYVFALALAIAGVIYYVETK